MNDKKAKHLRRLAAAFTVGKPMSVYVIVKRPWGAPPAPIRLHKDCTRYVYKQFKKIAGGSLDALRKAAVPVTPEDVASMLWESPT